MRVTADVTNTGAWPATRSHSSTSATRAPRVDRAVNDLKSFARIHLEPGETPSVAFDLRAADLAFWDISAGTWEVEPITYDVRVGRSSRDLPLKRVVCGSAVRAAEWAARAARYANANAPYPTTSSRGPAVSPELRRSSRWRAGRGAARR